MHSSTDEAIGLLRKWVATRASLRFVFSLDSATLVQCPKLPFTAEFDEAGRVVLSAEEWVFRFSLKHAALGIFRITEDEADSLLVTFPDGKLEIFAFNPVLPEDTVVQ